MKHFTIAILLAISATSNCLGQGLHQAAQNGDLEKVKILLSEGINPNIQDSDGNTPLHFAAGEGYLEIVQILLESGAHPDVRNDGLRTPLHLAAWRGNAEVVRLLIEAGANPNSKDNRSTTPHDFAVDRGYPEIVRFLIESGADKNDEKIQSDAFKRNFFNNVRNGRLEHVRAHLEVGSNPNTLIPWGNYGDTPLHAAAYHDLPEILSLLIEYGGDPNIELDNGETPLHYAVALNRPNQAEIISILIEAGADPDAQISGERSQLSDGLLPGETALSHAVRRCYRDNNMEVVVNLLLEAGADPILEARAVPSEVLRRIGERRNSVIIFRIGRRTETQIILNWRGGILERASGFGGDWQVESEKQSGGIILESNESSAFFRIVP